MSTFWINHFPHKCRMNHWLLKSQFTEFKIHAIRSWIVPSYSKVVLLITWPGSKFPGSRNGKNWLWTSTWKFWFAWLIMWCTLNFLRGAQSSQLGWSSGYHSRYHARGPRFKSHWLQTFYALKTDKICKLCKQIYVLPWFLVLHDFRRKKLALHLYQGCTGAHKYDSNNLHNFILLACISIGV